MLIYIGIQKGRGYIVSKRLKLFLILLGTMTILSFQNCGDGFLVSDTVSSSSAINNLKVYSPVEEKILYVGDSYTYKPIIRFTPDETFDSVEYEWYYNSARIDNSSDTLFLQSLAISNSGTYKVKVFAISKNSDLRLNVGEAGFKLRVTAAPATSSVPRVHSVSKSAYVPPGTDYVLSAVTSSYPQGQVTWYKNGELLVQQNGDYVFIEEAGFEHEGVYHFEINNSEGVVKSKPMLISVLKDKVAPKIVGDLSTVHLALNQTHEFSIDAVGIPEPTVTVAKSGSALSRNTNNNFVISNAQEVDSGTYTIVANNGEESFTSVNVYVVGNITFNEELVCKPVGVNKPLMLSYNITGLVDKVEWFFNDTLIAGASQETFQINSATKANEGTYKVRLTNVNGSVESSCDMIVVEPPELVTALVNQDIFVNEAIDLRVEVSGFGITYAWYKDNNLINGVNTANYFKAMARAGDSGVYKVIATNAAGSVESSATVMVSGAPVINTGIADYEAFNGETVNLTVTATGKGLTYQWFKDNVDLGVNSATLRISNFNAEDAGTYRVTITNPVGSVSDTAKLTYLEPPSITSPLVDKTIDEGDNVSLSTLGRGDGIQYIWYFNNRVITGETTRILRLTDTTLGQAGTYKVEVRNKSGSAFSEARLTVNPAN